MKLAHFSNENPEIDVQKIIAFKNSDPITRRQFVSDAAGFSLLIGVSGSSTFSGDSIDSNHEDMLSLAKEFNLELTDMYAESKAAGLIHETFFFNGRHISEEDIISEFKKVSPKLKNNAESLGEDYDTPAALILDKTTLEDYILSLNCAEWLKDIFTAAYLAEFGLDTSEQSAINFLDMIDTDTSSGFKIFITAGIPAALKA